MPTTLRDDRPLATELRFLVPASMGDQIRAWARQNMAPDPHAAGTHGDTYQTTTLYFDTPYFDVFHRRGSFGRSKYRVRRYGSSDLVFFERKLRTGNRLSKRRTPVPIDRLSRLETVPADLSWEGAWLHRRLLARELQPICVIRYRRMARVSMSPAGSLRLTVDELPQAWPVSRHSLEERPASADLIHGAMILELKYRTAVPGLFKRLLETFKLAPRKLSKYRIAAQALGLVPQTNELK
jgi:hypothetical protein